MTRCRQPGCEKPPRRARRDAKGGRIPRYCAQHGTQHAATTRFNRSEKARVYRAKWGREQRRADAYLMKKYGISAAEYEEILAAQGGVCAICKRPPQPNHRLCVDHRHDAKYERKHGPRGLVRGLLCWMDNYMLVNRHMTSERLRAAAEYLDSPPAVPVLSPVRKAA